MWCFVGGDVLIEVPLRSLWHNFNFSLSISIYWKAGTQTENLLRKITTFQTICKLFNQYCIWNSKWVLFEPWKRKKYVYIHVYFYLFIYLLKRKLFATLKPVYEPWYKISVSVISKRISYVTNINLFKQEKA